MLRAGEEKRGLELEEGDRADTPDCRAGRRGLWALRKFESPGEYKKRMKATAEAEDGMVGAKSTAKQERAKGVWGLLRRFFTRPL